MISNKGGFKDLVCFSVAKISDTALNNQYQLTVVQEANTRDIIHYVLKNILAKHHIGGNITAVNVIIYERFWCLFRTVQKDTTLN